MLLNTYVLRSSFYTILKSMIIFLAILIQTSFCGNLKQKSVVFHWRYFKQTGFIYWEKQFKKNLMLTTSEIEL